MANWIERFIAAIATHKSNANAHHTPTVAGDLNLADLAEKAHDSLTGVTSDQHHPQAHTLGSHTTKAHAELTNVTENQHHSKFTTVEHSAIGDAAPHHARYTNAEAQATVKANVEVGDLKAPTKALAMNAQNITGINSLTASELHGTTYWGDIYLEDIKCPICHSRFEKGDKIIFMINNVEEKHVTAVPVHLTCNK